MEVLSRRNQEFGGDMALRGRSLLESKGNLQASRGAVEMSYRYRIAADVIS